MTLLPQTALWFGLTAALIGTQFGPAATPAASPPPQPRRPCIVLILADDLGYSDLGCYGQQNIRTPHLDRLAAEGVRFTSFYAGSTVCAPSRAALMLGQHTGHLRIRGNTRDLHLGADEVSLARLLQQAGYRTGLIGKWGLGEADTPGAPHRQGFDDFLGYLDQVHAHDYYTDHLFRHDSTSGFSGRIELPENRHERRGLYTHDLFTRAAQNFIRLNKPEPHNRHRPFFLLLAWTIPHANNEEGRRIGNGMQVPTDAPYTDQPWPAPEKNKAAMITRLDADVGRLLDLLDELKIAEDTIVLFTSDNGPHREGGVDPAFHRSAGPLRGLKRDLYEGGIRVPLLVRWPAKIPGGRVVSEPWAMWDLLPTLAEAVRVTPPPGIDGISFLPTLVGQTQTNRHEYFYWEFHERGFSQALRWGDWKAVRPQAGQPLELFNLQSDPGEQRNVAADHPSVVARIEELLKMARTESDRWPANPGQGTGNR